MSQLVANAVQDHPILITLQDRVSGDGFLAMITLAGRTLMRKEEDGKWWMYGVRPAAIAESGCTIDEAFLRFRRAYKEVLFDFAQESKDFDEFRSEVERFFNEGDGDAELWESVLRTIRSENMTPPEPFAKLPRESPEGRPPRIEVERLDGQLKRHVASDNIADKYTLADKAA